MGCKVGGVKERRKENGKTKTGEYAGYALCVIWSTAYGTWHFLYGVYLGTYSILPIDILFSLIGIICYYVSESPCNDLLICSDFISLPLTGHSLVAVA